MTPISLFLQFFFFMSSFREGNEAFLMSKTLSFQRPQLVHKQARNLTTKEEIEEIERSKIKIMTTSIYCSKHFFLS